MSQNSTTTQILTSSLLILWLAFSTTSCSKQKTQDSTPLTKDTSNQPNQLVTHIENLSFNEHIQPILSVNCYHCHGPDSGTRLPEDEPLRLDTPEGAFALRKSGKPVIIKGDPDNSYLIQLIESKDPDLVMPLHPTKSPHGRIMTPEHIALIRRWVEEGANYEKHWAYIPPKKSSLQEVQNKDWIRNPIDNFILNKLEKNNLTPNPDEDKARLLRRLTLDLTGLPPTPDALESFLADTRDLEIVYAEKVTSLLTSDAYAEHFARHWLDVARYADTHGIHFDNYRSIWPYRDWVINAFRTNMKFDQFTIEQIAGDMLPNATLEQKIATGFHRCLPTTGEGGAIADEYLAIYAQERVDTTSAAWLGLTAGCAACHDHKFDAISTKENYQLTAFFRNTTMSALDKNNAIHPPNILIPQAQDRNRLAEARNEIKQLTTQQKQLTTKLEPSFQIWLKQLQNTPSNSHHPPKGILINLPLDNKEKGINNPDITSKLPLKWKDAPLGDAVHFTGGNEINLGNSGNFERDQSFSYGAWIKAPGNLSAGVIAKMHTTKDHRGYDLWVQNGFLAVHLIHHWPQNYIKVTTKKKFKPNQWMHVMVTYNGSNKPNGIKIYINGENQKLTVNGNKLTDSIKTDAPLLLGSRHLSQPFTNGQLQHFQLYQRALKPKEVLKIATEDQLIQLIKNGNPSKDKLNQAKQYYFNTVNPETVTLTTKIETLQKELTTIDSRGTRTLIMDVHPKKKPTAQVLIRGEYAIKDPEILTPNVPASLPPMTEDMQKNRLGLAQWLTDARNPLPARVTANRYWYYFFGKGIVETNKDFGVMGARPTHPKLLDYLAADFIENDWDLHHLIRQIVTSSTYRQSAVISKEKLTRDPQNKLLSRGPRYRLDAEQIRDLALSSSQLLHPEIGGPSVKPYQPTNIWESVAMKGSNTRNYKPDSGKKLYRRSLYTFWKRSAPHPTMNILNAPNREESCVQRELTNTPLQALVIMNDPQFVEASRQLAALALQSGNTTEARLYTISTNLLSRKLNQDETHIITATLNDLLEKFNQAPAKANKLISVGETKPPKNLNPSELAAWTIIANQILNMDETLNK